MTTRQITARKLRTGFNVTAFMLLVLAFGEAANAFDTAPYFPLNAGATWRYVVTKTNGASASIQFDRFAIGTAVVNGAPPTIVNGTTVNIIRDTRENHLFYYTNDGNGVRQHGEFDPTLRVGSGPTLPATLTFTPPQISLLPSATLGVPVTSSGIASFEIQELQGLAIFPLRYTTTSTPETFETFTSLVSGFTYHNALRVRTITTLSGTIMINQRSVSVNGTEETIDWLVPTLGV